MMKRLFLLLLAVQTLACAGRQKPASQSAVEAVQRGPDLRDFLGEVDGKRSTAEAPEVRHLLMGRLLLAGRSPQEVLDLARERGEGELARAALLARAGDSALALSVAKRHGDEGLSMAVAILGREGRWQEAADLLDEGPNTDLRTALRAWVAHELGRDEEAISTLRSHLYAKGTDLDAYRVLVRIFMAQGKYRLARLACQGALRIDPKDADMHYLMGRVDQSLKRRAGAQRAFRKAIKHDPSHLGARIELAREGLALLDYRGALEHLTVAYRLAPGEEEVALLTALALRANGGCNQAAELLAKWEGRSTRARFNLAVLNLRCLDNPKTAAVLLKRFVDEAAPASDHKAHVLLQEAELLSETE